MLFIINFSQSDESITELNDRLKGTSVRNSAQGFLLFMFPRVHSVSCPCLLHPWSLRMGVKWVRSCGWKHPWSSWRCEVNLGPLMRVCVMFPLLKPLNLSRFTFFSFPRVTVIQQTLKITCWRRFFLMAVFERISGSFSAPERPNEQRDKKSTWPSFSISSHQ